MKSLRSRLKKAYYTLRVTKIKYNQTIYLGFWKGKRERRMRLGFLREISYWFLDVAFRWLPTHYVTVTFISLIGLIIYRWDAIAILFSATATLPQALLGPESTAIAPLERDPGYLQPLRDIYLIAAAILGLLFLLIRTHIAERNTRAQEGGHDADRLVRAFKNLGAEKTIREKRNGEDREAKAPNHEVRTGAALALEKWAQEHPRDHWSVMEVLCAYIQNTNRDRPPADIEETLKEDPAKIATPRMDQTRQRIMEIIGHRHPMNVARDERAPSSFPWFSRNRALDLSGSNLCGLTLSGAFLDGCNLSEAWLVKADLKDSSLRYANLARVNLHDSKLEQINMKNADLREGTIKYCDFIKLCLRNVTMRKSCLRYSLFKDSDMSKINIEGSEIVESMLKNSKMNHSNMRKSTLKTSEEYKKPQGWHMGKFIIIGVSIKFSDLQQAKLQNIDMTTVDFSFSNCRDVNFYESFLNECIFQGVNLCGANFKDCKNLTQGHLDSAFGDSKTVLPEGLKRPEHWLKAPIGHSLKSNERWKAWVQKKYGLCEAEKLKVEHMDPPGRPVTAAS